MTGEWEMKKILHKNTYGGRIIPIIPGGAGPVYSSSTFHNSLH